MNFVKKLQFHGQQAVDMRGRDKLEYTFKLDPTQKPPTIDLIDANEKVLPGIYQFDGDLLTLSFDQHGNKGRPTSFDKYTEYMILGRDNP